MWLFSWFHMLLCSLLFSFVSFFVYTVSFLCLFLFYYVVLLAFAFVVYDFIHCLCILLFLCLFFFFFNIISNISMFGLCVLLIVYEYQFCHISFVLFQCLIIRRFLLVVDRSVCFFVVVLLLFVGSVCVVVLMITFCVCFVLRV